MHILKRTSLLRLHSILKHSEFKVYDDEDIKPRISKSGMKKQTKLKYVFTATTPAPNGMTPLT